MPLLDLRTNLKSLKYTGDQPGGGWSGKPYIQTAIPPTNLVSANPDTLIGAEYLSPIYRIQSTGTLDYPIRGGDVKFDLGTQTFTLSSQIDKSRIKKFFEDKPRGTAFLQKQIGLNLTNPKIETGNSFQVVPNSNAIPGLLENTRIYNNGLNTLSQVGVQGTGFHIQRQGVSPFDYASKYYAKTVGAQSLLSVDQVVKTNRLLILQNLKLSTSPTSTNLGNVLQINKLGISLNRNILFQYLGGPGSVYGIGSTVIKRSLDSDTSKAATGKFRTSVSMTYDAIMNQNLNKVVDGTKPKNIQDYRTSKPFVVKSREDFYSLNMNTGPDKMNMLKSFVFNNSSDPWADGTNLSSEGRKDIIKFVFEAIENKESTRSWAIFFRAYLSGLSDSHQASINSFKYQGRGEDFYTYQGVSRAINFSFKIAVESEKEQQSLYTKLNHLISQVYPDYSENYGIMRAPMMRLTIGDYLFRTAGMIDNVNITVDDNVPWDINIVDSTGKPADRRQLPQVINVQCSFKPIQDFLPRKINEFNTNVPFITNPKEKYVSLEDHQTMIRNIDKASYGLKKPTFTKPTDYFEKNKLKYAQYPPYTQKKVTGLNNTGG